MTSAVAAGRSRARLAQEFVQRHLWRRFSECVLGAQVAIAVELPPLGLPVTMVPIAPGTLDDILALNPPQIQREVAVGRFQRGDHGVAAQVNDRIVSSVWIGGTIWQLRDLGIAMPLAPDQGVLYDAYTAPDVRRLGIMALLVRACVEQAKARGQRWLFARAIATNTNTMSTLGRAGFKEIMSIRGVLLTNVLGFYRITGSGDSPVVRALLSGLVPQRPGLLVWECGGRRGFRVLVPRFVRRRDGGIV